MIHKIKFLYIFIYQSLPPFLFYFHHFIRFAVRSNSSILTEVHRIICVIGLQRKITEKEIPFILKFLEKKFISKSIQSFLCRHFYKE